MKKTEVKTYKNSAVLVMNLDGLIYSKGMKYLSFKEDKGDVFYSLFELEKQFKTLMRSSIRTVEFRKKIGYWNPKVQEDLK